MKLTVNLQEITAGMRLSEVRLFDNIYAPHCGKNGSVIIEDIDDLKNKLVVFVGEDCDTITQIGANESPQAFQFTRNSNRSLLGEDSEEQLTF